jgi:hypothetical protein
MPEDLLEVVDGVVDIFALPDLDLVQFHLVWALDGDVDIRTCGKHIQCWFEHFRAK